MKNIIIIGAGTSGLAAAIRLQTLGFKVEIYEKNTKSGGRMYQIEKNGFTFDAGPTIVMMPNEYKDVFRFSKANPDDYINMTLLDPMYEVHFPNHSKLAISSDLTKLVEQFEAIGDEDTQGYLAYLADVYKRYSIAKKHFLEKPFRSPFDFFNPKSLYNILKLRTLNSAYASISKFVKDDRLRKALAFQTLYIGISPFIGPSIYTIIPMIELLYGVWYIKGGMYQMAKAMERRFLELGGKIHFSQEVSEIIVENKQVKGIVTNQKEVIADIVLCNADFPWAVKNLIKDQKRKGKYNDQKIERMQYSSSAFILYIGLNKKYKSTVHQIRFAKDFNKNIEDLFNRTLPEDPSFYMYLPSQIDASVAPKDKEALYVLVPVPSLHKNPYEWNEEETNSYKEKTLSLIEQVEGFEDLRNHIEVLEVFTPKTFEKTFNLQFGATFGLKPTLSQSNYFRPQHKFHPVDNLYFVGSSNHPGAGVPIVLISAKLAVAEIVKDHKVHESNH